MINIASFIQSMIAQSIVLLFATTGQIFAERAGVLNIGMEGILLMSASTGFVTTYYSQSLILGTMVGILTGLIMGLFLSVLSTSLRIDQSVLGIGIWLVGLGFSDNLAGSHVGHKPIYIRPFEPITLPLISDTPVGTVTSQNWLAYLAIFLAVFSYFILYKTTFGLKVKAVGDDPTSADTVGIRVYRIRHLCVIISCVIGSLGGIYVTLGHTGTWYFGLTAGAGFIAIAIARLANWNPLWGLAAVLAFSGLTNVQFILQATGTGIPHEFFQAMPYLITLLILTGSLKVKRKAPKALGIPYERESKY